MDKQKLRPIVKTLALQTQQMLALHKGGPGSGNFGHEGRPGQVGGSGDGEGAPAAPAGKPASKPSDGGGSNKPDNDKPTSKPAGGKADVAKLLKEDPGYAEHYKKTKPGLIFKQPWQKLGIEHAEAAAMRDYTDLGYQGLNKGLRNPPPPPAVAAKADLLNAGLDKLPPHKGEVYRGLASPRDWEVGATIKEAGFSSSSTKKEIAEENFAGKTFLSIKSKNGKSVQKMSRFKGEDEVVFKAGTEFKVISKRKEGDKVYYEMEEV